MSSNTWQDILDSKCYLLNMDVAIDRMRMSSQRIFDAGFTNLTRFRGLDGKKDDIVKEWEKHGSPKLGNRFADFLTNKGIQACALGHYGIWKDIIDNNVPIATIFEDDVQFHKYWDILAKEYWNITNKDFDVLYLGSQIEEMNGGNVITSPVYCTHAYIITLEGAKKLYKMCLIDGTYNIDILLINYMYEKKFTWYVWKATQFHDDNRSKDKEWEKRNWGLVFQDYHFGTCIGQ